MKLKDLSGDRWRPRYEISESFLDIFKSIENKIERLILSVAKIIPEDYIDTKLKSLNCRYLLENIDFNQEIALVKRFEEIKSLFIESSFWLSNVHIP